MNKSQLIDAIAQQADLPKNTAAKALDALTASITDALKAGDNVSLTGFGVFSVSTRAAREGRNPLTGETVQIAARKAATFKAGKGLKEAIN